MRTTSKIHLASFAAMGFALATLTVHVDGHASISEAMLFGAGAVSLLAPIIIAAALCWDWLDERRDHDETHPRNMADDELTIAIAATQGSLHQLIEQGFHPSSLRYRAQCDRLWSLLDEQHSRATCSPCHG